jgi:hypothetical protein
MMIRLLPFAARSASRGLRRLGWHSCSGPHTSAVPRAASTRAIPAARAPTKPVIAASLGKMPTTRVRRLRSSFRGSSCLVLVLQLLRQRHVKNGGITASPPGLNVFYNHTIQLPSEVRAAEREWGLPETCATCGRSRCSVSAGCSADKKV